MQQDTNPGHHAGSWQGQAGQHHETVHTYYDPTHPYAWQQATHLPPGGQQRPPKKRWWMWTVLTVIAIGLLAIVMTLLTTDESETDPETQSPLATPFDTGQAEDTPDLSQEPVEEDLRRADDGSFILDGAGHQDDALAAAQERVDAGYSNYGPGDLLYILRAEGYQNAAIEHALNHLDVDWKAQALGVAQRLVASEYAGYSAQELQQHLAYSEFAADEIDYALEHLEVDYTEQAVQALQSYAEVVDDPSQDAAREYLTYAGFTQDEIDYALDNAD